MTSEEMMRFDCLKLALERADRTGEPPLELAEAFFAFVVEADDGPAPQEATEADSP